MTVDWKEIESLKAQLASVPTSMPTQPIAVQSEKLDMNALYNTFAMRAPPDNTINRIATLEAKMIQLSSEDRVGKSDLDALLKQITVVKDKVNKDHD